MSTAPSRPPEPGAQSSAERARRALAASHSAFVLHSYDWSESSLIVELFTRDAGRVVAAAKGAKRPTSQLRAVLMPFQPVAVQFARYRGDDASEVRTLRSAEWGGGQAPAMRGAAWFAGFYLNELVLRLLARDDPHPRLFDAYAGTLPCLPDEARGEAALRAFELLLLRESGVLPELDRTTLTQSPLAADGRYALQSGQGLGEAAPGTPALPGSVWLALATALRLWSSPRESGADALEPLQAACALGRQTLKAQLRAQLHYHLGGAMLRTRQVMIDTQRLLEDAKHPR